MPNAELEQLGADYWDAFLERNPTQGTVLGDHRYDDRLSDITPAGRGAAERRLDDLYVRLANLDTAALTDEESLSVLALRHGIGADLTFLEADELAYTVSPANGPQVEFLNLADLQPLRDAGDADAMLARWRAMGGWIDDLIANHRRGQTDGNFPIAILVERVVSELDEILTRPIGDVPLLQPLRRENPPLPPAVWRRFAGDLEDAVRDGVLPAFRRYRSYLADEALPTARDQAHAGIANLLGGYERYAALAHAHTTTEIEPDGLHAIGQEEIALIDAEIADLGKRALGTGSLAATLASLRGDKSLYFSTRDEVMGIAERSLRAAEEAIPDWFGRVPVTPCEVVRMLPHEEAHSTIAYYREPAADGGRPGRYYVNTSEPQTRPRYEAQALAFHESVPGHHLQIAIGQELTALPTFRRHAEATAFIEGWGLYSERLANEMGLYAGDVDRIGMLSYDAWRACRLVVDTGMHALKWDRERALSYLREHTTLSPDEAANEIDRYAIHPAQALAYMVGQLELIRLRDEARRRMGERFDLRDFHDAVLAHGSVPLSSLERLLREHAESVAARVER